MNDPHIIGLAGGVASGKSAVAGILAEHGAEVLDADAMAHAVLNEHDVREQIVQRWGASVLDQVGQVDRAEVARRVFGPNDRAEAERRFLEQLLHPRVRQQVEQAVAAARRGGATAVVIDAPLLLEAGWGEMCDRVLFVDAPAEVRRERIADRGWTEEDLARREDAQMSLADKRAAATHVISNAGDMDALREQVDCWRREVALD